MKIDAATVAAALVPVAVAHQRDQQWRAALERAQRDLHRDPPAPGEPPSRPPVHQGPTQARTPSAAPGSPFDAASPAASPVNASAAQAVPAPLANASATALASGIGSVADRADMPATVRFGPLAYPEELPDVAQSSEPAPIEAWIKTLDLPVSVVRASVRDGRLDVSVRDARVGSVAARRLVARIRAQAAAWGLEVGAIHINGRAAS